MSIRYFEIADLVLRVENRDNLLPVELKDFETQALDNSCVIAVTFENNSYLRRISGKVILKDTILTIYENDFEFIIKYSNSEFVDLYVNDKEKMTTAIYLKEGVNPTESLTNVAKEEISVTIRDAFFFHMQKMGRIAIHSASIIYRDEVWAFAAKSGVGKSTHVKLWHEAEYTISDFNGDILIAYIKDGISIAAGSPWCGTSEIYVNDKVKLGGIVFLQRDFYNHVRMYTAPETISKIVARSLTPNWTREQFDKNVQVATALEKLTLCGVLECLPDEGAADVAKRYIDDLYVYRKLRK